MSSDHAFPVRHGETASHRAALALHGMALNALFPAPPRVPDDMLAMLSRLDRVRS